MLDAPGSLRRNMTAVYGGGRLLEERTALVAAVVRRFLETHGDQPLRIFRSPGRINLRGMHVDTHGGRLNLMTHHRETVVAAAASGSSRCHFVNLEPAYGEARFELADGLRDLSGIPWDTYIGTPRVTARVRERRTSRGGDWANYLEGACLRTVRELPAESARGLLAAVGSDLPRGAALSSSAALCVSVLLAMHALNGLPSPPEALIRAEQDAEWFAGARVGMSDQGAMILGQRGRLLNAALFAEDFCLEDAVHHDWPEGWEVLVVNSHTRRALSGAQLVDYTRNRFAYSMAMHVLRRAMLEVGVAPERVQTMDRLPRITPDAFGGVSGLYALLAAVPEDISLDALADRYAPPAMGETYEKYFGAVDPALRPTHIRLRGPLAFGLAESERARTFPEFLRRDDAAGAGRLMSIGHDGDRVCDALGHPRTCDLSNAALARMAGANAPLADCPGAYGASSRVLDFLVDGALEAGALGACLTGAGIAGAVLVLCRREDHGRIADALRNRLASGAYRERGGRETPLTPAELEAAVVVNRSTAGACEILPEP
ncbi:MAG: hypothetical protein GXY15_11490 [Candidatus Hydrogenedentes bacterium]|nr:hypothetical protein [Candidatus Hydrogenedentota bacterium]